VSAVVAHSQDLTKESLLSLAQAARKFPPYRLGRPVSPSCIWRWCREGVRVPGVGVVRLESIRIAGRWLTSQEAISRFVARQTPPSDDEQVIDAPRTSSQRKKASERAARELDKLRI
jgi:hypothetical protein